METQALIVDTTTRSFHVSVAHLLVGLISAFAAVTCALLHYEFMSITSLRLALTRLPRRARVLGLMIVMLFVHVIEVWIFAGLYWLLDRFPSLGHLDGPFEEGALDFIYFSAVSFTTIGFGDITPMGAIRILCGTEALVGLSLITWSASLAFLEMQRDWAEFRHPAFANNGSQIERPKGPQEEPVKEPSRPTETP